MTIKKYGLKDYSFAKKTSLTLIIVFLFGAIIGINNWPYQALFHGVTQSPGFILFSAFRGVSTIFLLLFLGAKPTKQTRWIILISGLTITISYALYFKINNPITWLADRGSEGIVDLISFFAAPALIYLLLRVTKLVPPAENSIFEQNLINLFSIFILFIAFPYNALELGVLFNPLVHDLYAMHWDASAHLNFGPELYAFIHPRHWLSTLVSLAYGFTPIGFLLVAIKQLNGFPNHVASAAKTWVIMTACAIFAYSFFPITGPKYIFGSEHYFSNLNDSLKYALYLIPGSSAPRNGMPSMHFGWMLASTILWWQTGSSWWSKVLFVIVTCLTMTATIFLGEHYVVDLIVAVPFVLASIGLCTTSVSWSHPEKKWVVAGGFITWFVWILVLRNLVPFADNHPWFCWVMNGATAVVVVFQYRAMKKFRHLADTSCEITDTGFGTKVRFLSSFESKVGLMFFVSGAAALIYQVLFAKKLALTFGSTATATLTVLATFLGGMAIGSFFGGKFSNQSKHPLRTYAFIEGLIALYCVGTPYLFNLTQTIYVSIATGLAPEAPLLLILRICLGSTVLLIPTILMGTTLPLLAQVLNSQSQRLGPKVALLYLLNTAGAAIGALLSSYLLIPSVGVGSTTLIAAMLNLLVALGGLELAKTFNFFSANYLKTNQSPTSALPSGATQFALATLCIGGILSLGLEVVYVHMLSIVAGNSVYAFGLMLATFLSGLSVGGFIAKTILQKNSPNQLRWLAYSFIGLALCTSISTYFWNAVPDYFAGFAEHNVARGFNAREAIRAVVCALIMLQPTAFIGAAYVFGMDIITNTSQEKQIPWLGIGAALNTTGNIAGVLVFGFFLLPAIGGLSSTHVISSISLIVAVLLFYKISKTLKPLETFGLALTICAVLLFARIPLNYEALSSGSNVYFAPQPYGRVIDHTESIDGGLTSVTQPENSEVKTLLTNGKFQGNNSWTGEMQAQIGFAFAPLMHQEKRRRALIIGYGTGVTSRVFKDAGFKELDIAELSSDIVNMANKHFSEVNQKVSAQPSVNLHVTDGRNMLLLTPSDHLYDVVSLEITSIWFAGAASLYNKEFYQLVKAHMTPDGVLQQWVQLHHLNPMDILSIITTLRMEFKYISLYEIGGQGILIATNDIHRKDANTTALNEVKQNNSLRAILANGNQSLEKVKTSLLLSNEEIDKYVAKIGVEPSLWISNDDNLYLEYSTPKGNVNNSFESYNRNLRILKQFQMRN